MKVYIRKNAKTNEFFNINYYIAYDGFKELGAEIIAFTDIRKISDYKIEDIIVSGIGDVRYIFDKFKINYPTLEYPHSISNTKYLGRNIWKDKLGLIMSNKDKWNIFVKPVEGGKLFTGTIIRESKDFRGCVGANESTEVWCSEILDFVSEYRCFIRYGQLLDIKHYKGDCFLVPNRKVLGAIMNDYEDSPNAYTIDLGITSTGETFLVEVNEGYSVGAYGLNSIKYAKLLATRWAELTNTEDEYFLI